MRNGLLHELLAVEGDLRSNKEKERDQVIGDFISQPASFLGAIKTLKMFDEDRANEDGEVRVEVADTVQEKLHGIVQSFSRYWDCRIQKEVGNQMATADVVIDGKSVFVDVPVTFLLNMEQELTQIRKVYTSIPTLKPGVEWKEDGAKGRGIYKSVHNTETSKTEKSVQHRVMVQATEHFPAQVEKWSEDRPIGKYITENWSGMLSEAQKSIYISRVDRLIKAFKQARQRANCTETMLRSIGIEVFNYIHQGDVTK